MRTLTDRQSMMKKLGVTLREVAEALGISEQMVSVLVRGKHPQSAHIQALDDYLEAVRKQRVAELIR